MTDSTAQNPSPSYVDTYSPPQPTVGSGTPAVPQTVTKPPAEPQFSAPTPTMTVDQPAATVSSAPVPPVASSSMSAAPVQQEEAPAQSPISQALEDQNIFFLLGVTAASEDEKEAFLDELQQVIWEDFLENDVELLITEEEMTELKTLVAKKGVSDLEQQEAIVTFLEKLIPDLEEIMLEKALELKADMVKERIAGMKEYYAQQPQVVEQLTKTEELIADDQWREAAEVLNSIT